jgi:Zn-dependent protease
MMRPLTIGALHGSNLRLHWSWPLLPLAASAYSFATLRWTEAVFEILLLAAAYLCVLVHEGIELLAARRFGFGTRDVMLYPFWGVARHTRLSDWPWQENYIAATGPVAFALIATIVGGVLAAIGTSIEFTYPATDTTVTFFLVHLFWVNVFLAVLHCLPVLPLDGGRIFRASLAMTTSRLRATEVAAALSTVGAGVLLIAAIFWLKSPLLGVTAGLLYLGAQEDLGTTRYFAGLRHATADSPHTPAVLVPLEQVITPECRPEEANFTGFTWNARARLWIEWRDGHPVSANALIGDGRP